MEEDVTHMAGGCQCLIPVHSHAKPPRRKRLSAAPARSLSYQQTQCSAIPPSVPRPMASAVCVPTQPVLAISSKQPILEKDDADSRKDVSFRGVKHLRATPRRILQAHLLRLHQTGSPAAFQGHGKKPKINMNSAEDCYLKTVAHQIRTDDKAADRIGAMFAAVLNCKRDKEHKDRWITDWGTKTNIGLARTILSTLENEGEQCLRQKPADYKLDLPYRRDTRDLQNIKSKEPT